MTFFALKYAVSLSCDRRVAKGFHSNYCQQTTGINGVDNLAIAVFLQHYVHFFLRTVCVTERIFDCVYKNGHGSSYFYFISSSGRSRNYSVPSPERASEN